MKKQLLFTIAFLGALTFGFAQVSYDSTTGGEQSFTVGKQAGDVVGASSLSGTVTGGIEEKTNNSWLGWGALVAGDAAAGATTGTGTLVFTVTTDSATEINEDVILQFDKRAGCNVDATVVASGNGNNITETIDEDTNGTTDPFSGSFYVTLQDVALVSGTPATITVNLTGLIGIDNTDKSIFKLEGVTVGSVTLSNDDANMVNNNIGLYPNPVTNSFQLSSTEDVQNVQIYSITGSLLKTFNKTANYDISDLATGVYIANIKTELGSKALRVVKE